MLQQMSLFRVDCISINFITNLVKCNFSKVPQAKCVQIYDTKNSVHTMTYGKLNSAQITKLEYCQAQSQSQLQLWCSWFYSQLLCPTSRPVGQPYITLLFRHSITSTSKANLLSQYFDSRNTLRF